MESAGGLFLSPNGARRRLVAELGASIMVAVLALTPSMIVDDRAWGGGMARWILRVYPSPKELETTAGCSLGTSCLTWDSCFRGRPPFHFPPKWRGRPPSDGEDSSKIRISSLT